MRNKLPRERLELLQSVPLFKYLNPKELARVDRLFTIHDLAAGQVLTTEQTVGRQAFIILSGRAAVTIRGRRIERRRFEFVMVATVIAGIWSLMSGTVVEMVVDAIRQFMT